VLTARSDSEFQRSAGYDDKLRIPHYFAMVISLLGVVIFQPVYYLGSVAVVTLTILRAQNDKNSGGDRKAAGEYKPSELL
jgi:hypothetical protein